MSMVLVAITTLLLTTSATPAQAAPFVERINWWQVESISTNFPNCDFANILIATNRFDVRVLVNATWTGVDHVAPNGADLFPILVTMYDSHNRVIGGNTIMHPRLQNLPSAGTYTHTVNVGLIEPNIISVTLGAFAPVVSRPWRLVAQDYANYGEPREELGRIIFDPADYGYCEDLPYIGTESVDPIIDASSQDTAIYNSQDDDGNPSLDVYGINDEGEGYYVFSITEELLAPYIDLTEPEDESNSGLPPFMQVEEPPEINTEIMTVDNVALYVLTTGEFQLNIGPDEEGKVRVVIFNGLPPTNVYSYDYNVYDILGE